MKPRVISLFSGAGTFDHGFHLAGWDTVYLCEWDEKARQVLQARFPGVPITNDVREVNGAELPDAECIMFGSPCQDLSVAGKRGGLEGERSGLFMEAIRIIREKREATNGRYPTFALWENLNAWVDWSCLFAQSQQFVQFNSANFRHAVTIRTQNNPVLKAESALLAFRRDVVSITWRFVPTAPHAGIAKSSDERCPPRAFMCVGFPLCDGVGLAFVPRLIFSVVLTPRLCDLCAMFRGACGVSVNVAPFLPVASKARAYLSTATSAFNHFCLHRESISSFSQKERYTCLRY